MFACAHTVRVRSVYSLIYEFKRSTVSIGLPTKAVAFCLVSLDHHTYREGFKMPAATNSDERGSVGSRHGIVVGDNGVSLCLMYNEFCAPREF